MNVRECFKMIIQKRRDMVLNNQNKTKDIKLLREEIKAIEQCWGKLDKSSYNCFKFYKKMGVFNPEMVPNSIYAQAERILNPFRYSLFLQHKCCLKFLLEDKYRPKTIIQNIDNHYIDKDDNIITKKKAIELVKCHSQCVIKIAAGSGGGRGVIKIKNTDDISSIFSLYNKDFICQEILKEHPTLSQFNPKCINTIRVLSLNINDNCTILSSFVRMGGLGSFVDNLHSTEGNGALVGLKPDGSLHSFGIDKNYRVVSKSPMGNSFEGVRIEHYDKVVDFVKQIHSQRFPFANLIGWDIIIDENESPIAIEINLDSADIAAHQIFNGPIFGNRREEVMEYIKKNPQKLLLRL